MSIEELREGHAEKAADPRPAHQAVALLGKHLEIALLDVSLSLPQYRLLAFLGSQHFTASRLADLLVVSRPSITALVDGLVARGLVARQHSTDDRRQVFHTLTPTGATALTLADEAVRTAMNELLSVLTPDEQESARLGLRLVATAIAMQCDDAAPCTGGVV